MTIAELIKRLEGADGPSHALNMDIAEALGDALGCTYSDSDVPDFTGSLDAALKLLSMHHSYEIAHCSSLEATCTRVFKGPMREDTSGEPTGYHPWASIALVIAALKAIEAQR